MHAPTQRRRSGAPAIVMSLALAVGAFGAVVAYRAVAQAGGAPTSDVAVSAVPTTPPRPVERPRTVVRWAPCTRPAVLRHGVCVTEKVREVVLAAPAAPPVVQPVVAHAPAAASGGRHRGHGSAHGTGEGGSGGHADHAQGATSHTQDGSGDGPEQETQGPPEVESGD